jgi:hypothetical protein
VDSSRPYLNTHSPKSTDECESRASKYCQTFQKPIKVHRDINDNLLKEKKMKNLILLTTILLFSANSMAHSGRTDSNGGHNCSKKSQDKGLCTGYHYHNGNTSEPSSPEGKVQKVSSDSISINTPASQLLVSDQEAPSEITAASNIIF